MTPNQEDRDLERLADRLRAGRPVPQAGFRGELRRDLLRRFASQPASPRRARLLVAAYGGSGLALIVIAAVGLAGAGPFAAG
jgi:hypothetical protein